MNVVHGPLPALQPVLGAELSGQRDGATGATVEMMKSGIGGTAGRWPPSRHRCTGRGAAAAGQHEGCVSRSLQPGTLMHRSWRGADGLHCQTPDLRQLHRTTILAGLSRVSPSIARTYRTAVIWSLWGARSLPSPVSCGDDRGERYGIMIIRVLAPALPHLRPALRLAGPARPVTGLQGRRAARAETRGRGAAPYPSAAPARLGRPSGPRRADPAAAGTAADAPAGHARYRPAVAPPPGHPPLDLPEPDRTASGQY